MDVGEGEEREVEGERGWNRGQVWRKLGAEEGGRVYGMLLLDSKSEE